MSAPQKGRPAKNPEKKFKRLAITMPPVVEEMLRKASYDTGKSLSEIVTESVERELAFRTKATPITFFPMVPLYRAAAGLPDLGDAEMVEPDRDLGEGRFLLELRGDSMEPDFQDRQRIVMRDKSTLKRPVLKYGQFYCFSHFGKATFKQWAKDDKGRKVLRSLNPEYPDIPADEDTNWIGWYDENDNQ